MLPIKLISSHALRSGNVSLTSWLPFSSSRPTLTIATLGFLIPRQFSIYIEPILAHCTRKAGLASTLAPLSTISTQPLSVGTIAPIGGLSTPGRRPTITCPPTNIAPELPADTKASASLFLTILRALTKDESFLCLIAITGGSPVSITSVALTTSICSLL